MSEAIDWYSPEAATFGDRLAAGREAAGMTQQELAKRLGIKLKTLQSWENDLSEPRANRLSTMAGLVNVSITWLINGEGEGLSAPEDEAISPDLNAVIMEIRTMRAQMTASAEKLGRLEKRLRTYVKHQEDE
ncbi:helix-turn-helix domain-containing protein [Thalassococcus lentus]|uniref:Helix-turn-helix transcriptional regulator n=1 Tax=Thalassococcus lentus TaxID=1210524 RepID=A0ABT4XWK7_9RHOB|nr:helix-turn-helix transcriptional regulator [Thalassococcus lentus]MDA7426353.1 helix-turn-helix transcriptional regulator [Thalassococcus lentus]